MLNCLKINDEYNTMKSKYINPFISLGVTQFKFKFQTCSNTLRQSH
jgi:hypothetical protein